MDALARVKELGEERGFSLYRISQESGIPYTTFNSAEKRGGALSVDTIERVCAFLRIPLGIFFDKNCLTLQEVSILRTIIREHEGRATQ